MWNTLKNYLNQVRKLEKQTKQDWDENVQPFIDKYIQELQKESKSTN